MKPLIYDPYHFNFYFNMEEMKDNMEGRKPRFFPPLTQEEREELDSLARNN